MTAPTLRAARTYTAAATALTVCTGYLGTYSLWCLLPGLYVAALLTWCAIRNHALHRTAEAERQADRQPQLATPLTDAERDAFNDLAARLQVDGAAS